MEKEKFSLARIYFIFIFLVSIFFYSHTGFAQCTNPDTTGESSQTFCKSDNSTIESLVASGGTIVWFDAITAGSQYNPSTPLIDGNTYYADDINDGNCSPNRLAVLVSIYGQPPSNVDVFVGKCAIDNPTISDLSATGLNIAWYDAQSGGNLFNSSDLLIDGSTYWVQQTENGCTSERLPTTVTMVNPPAPNVDQNQTFCSSSNPTVADLKATETNITWYEYETSTEPLNLNLPLIDGKDYWAAQTTFPCEGTVRSLTNVVIDISPNAGTDGTYSECEANLTATNLFELLGGTPDNTGTWSGPSTLTGGYLGTFEPGVNTEGTYTYLVSSSIGICPNDTSNVNVSIITTPPPTAIETSQTFCEVDNPTVANLNATGNGILWYDTGSSSIPLNVDDILINGEDYWATQTDTSGCESSTRLMVTASIISPQPPTTTETNQTFCEVDNPTVADLNATGNGVLWYDTETSTSALNDTDSLINGEDYWATQTDTNGCSSATRLAVTTSIISTPPPTTSESNQTFCEVDNPTVADLNATGNGILWYDTESSTTPLNDTDSLINGEDYWASQTDTSGCESSTRLVVTASIISTTPPTTTETNQTFCEVDNPTVADLNATGNGVLWYDTESSTTPLNDTDSLINGEDYWATQTDANGCSSATRLVVTTSIISTPPPTTTETNQTFCEVDNPTVADLNATGNGILWYDTESSTTPLNDTDSLINGEDYWAEQTDANGCSSATRLAVNASIISTPPPTTTEINQTFCEIDNPTVNDLTADGEGILWYDTETSTSALNSADYLVNGEDYWATQTDISGCESSTRMVVTASIISTPPPTTTETSQTFCEVDNPTVADLNATGNGILWYDTGSSSIPLDVDDILINGEDYWATQTDANGCSSATRLAVNASIISTPPPTTTEINQTFCEIDNPTVNDLTADGEGILWYDTETSTSALNSADYLVNGEDYWATQTDANSCSSATRLVVTASIISTPPPTTSESNQTFCEVDNPTVADLTADGEGILWYDTESSTTPLNDTDSLINGEDYWAEQTDANGCSSANRLAVSASIISTPPPTTTEINQTFCEIDNPTVNDLTADGEGILWYDTESSTTPLNDTDSLINGEDYWATQTDANGCSSANRLAVSASIISTPPPTTTETNQTFCEIDNPTVVDLNATGNGILWYDTESSTTPLNDTDSLINGEDYWAEQTDANGCSSANRLVVTATIISSQSKTEVTQSFCANDPSNSPLISDLTAPEEGLIWYNNETSTTPLNPDEILINGEDYWATLTDLSGCVGGSKFVVTVTFTSPLPPTTTEAIQTFCQIDNPTVANLNATGDNIIWYATETSTTPIGTDEDLINGEDYWATQTNDSGCESSERLVVTASIISTPPPTTTEVNQTYCEIDNPTVENLDVTGNAIVWYESETSTIPLNIDEALVNGEDYWATQTNDSGCESSERLVINTTIISSQSNTEVTQSFCTNDFTSNSPLVSDLIAPEDGLLWYDSDTSATPLDPNENLINGEDYWTTLSENSGCNGASKFVVTASIIIPLPPTTTETNQTFCEVNNPTVANLNVTGNDIIWYDSEISTTPLNPSDVLINNEDYWAEQTEDSGCKSASRLMVTATIVISTPPTTTESSQTFCEVDSPTVTNLNATGDNIVWYATETSTTPLGTDENLINGEDYWATQTVDSGCESSARLVVTAFINSTSPPTIIEANQSFCEIDNPTIANLNAIGNAITWYESETSTTPLNVNVILINGANYWATQTNATGCESATRIVVNTAIISSPPPTTTIANQTFCEIDNPTIADLTITGNEIIWYDSETSTAPLNVDAILINGEDYWATQTEASGCESVSRLEINAIISNLAIATTTQINQTFCSMDNPTIASLQVSGDSILWFDTETSTTPLNETDALIDGEDYWALNYDQTTGCESNSKLMITATILEVQSPTIENTFQVFCASSFPKISDLQANENIVWYATETETNPLKSTDLLINGANYWAAQSDSNSCESATRVVVNVTLTDAGTPLLNSIGNEFCSNFNPTLADLNENVSPLNGGIITWYDSYPNGNELSLTEFLNDSETYYAIESDSDGCSSANPLAVTVDLNACEQYDISIYDGFSPNGNGINDTFKIGNLRELYPDFKVEFYNRWGNLVYTSNISKPDWNGRLNGNDKLVTAGVYYFIIYFNKDDKKPIQRRLYLSR